MSDSPYNEDGTVDWTFFDRPAKPGYVYGPGEDYGQPDVDYSTAPMTLENAAAAYGYGNLDDFEKRTIYNESFLQPSEDPLFINTAGTRHSTAPPAPDPVAPDPLETYSIDLDGRTVSTIPGLPGVDPDNISVETPDPSINTAGFSWEGFYDKFLSGMPPFSLFPGGTLFEFGQGLFGNDDTKPDSPEEELGRNVGGTFDLLSNPLILMVLIMGMTGRGGSSMSSLLPLLILLPMLSGQNLQGGQMQ